MNDIYIISDINTKTPKNRNPLEGLEAMDGEGVRMEA